MNPPAPHISALGICCYPNSASVLAHAAPRGMKAPCSFARYGWTAMLQADYRFRHQYPFEDANGEYGAGPYSCFPDRNGMRAPQMGKDAPHGGGWAKRRRRQ